MLMKIPVINLIVDSLDRDAPPFEGVINALNAMGLLSALCLTIAFAYPSAVSYDVHMPIAHGAADASR